jgi:hypothetical protein
LIRELKIMVRTHCQVGQALCALCGQPGHAVKSGTGLYDGAVHLGDVCQQCLHGGRRGASSRTRTHSIELRRMAEQARTYPENRLGVQYYVWLCRYADFLDGLASRVETMTAWIPRPE